MKISGFTFIRNAVKYDFPIVEVITSVLDLVDEFVVNVGKSDDDTLEMIHGLRSPKLKVVETVWDDTLLKDGKVFGMQQDIALSQCTGDWAFLLQGDEVVHESDLPVIRQAMEDHLHTPDVVGLVFHMLHFKGDYWSIDPWMYHKATRIVRNTPDVRGRIRSTTDCCDFMAEGHPSMIKSSPAGRLIDARIFHYGWVKDSQVLEHKLRFQIRRHDGEKLSAEEIAERAMMRSRYPTYDILREYRGTHPLVMSRRIAHSRRLRPRRSRWLNWRFYREVFMHGFKG
jgi:hypothetical protein